MVQSLKMEWIPQVGQCVLAVSQIVVAIHGHFNIIKDAVGNSNGGGCIASGWICVTWENSFKIFIPVELNSNKN